MAWGAWHLRMKVRKRVLKIKIQTFWVKAKSGWVRIRGLGSVGLEETGRKKAKEIKFRRCWNLDEGLLQKQREAHRTEKRRQQELAHAFGPFVVKKEKCGGEAKRTVNRAHSSRPAPSRGEKTGGNSYPDLKKKRETWQFRIYSEERKKTCGASLGEDCEWGSFCKQRWGECTVLHNLGDAG